MLSLLKLVVKGLIFAVVVLIVANWLRWDGKTISDQVRTQMAHAERSDVANKVRGWAGSVTHDARHGAGHASRGPAIVSTNDDVDGVVEFHSSERQKLRALIRELNTSPERK